MPKVTHRLRPTALAFDPNVVPEWFMARVSDPRWNRAGVHALLDRNPAYPHRDWLIRTVEEGLDPLFRGPEKESISDGYPLDPSDAVLLQEAVDADVRAGLMIGPFSPSAPPLALTKAAATFTRPKGPGKIRPITDFSSPRGHSLNDGISVDSLRCSYVKTDDICRAMYRRGRGAKMCVADIVGAFRMLSHRPCFYHLHGIIVNAKLYYDLAAGFGGRSSPGLFARVGTLYLMDIHRALDEALGEVSLYCDDFWGISEAILGLEGAENILGHITEAVETSGASIAPHKTQLGSVVDYIGLTFDTDRMEVRLGADRIKRLLSEIRDFKRSRLVRMRSAESLAGRLVHACKAIRSGRTFVRRMYNEFSSQSRHKRFRPSRGFLLDLKWFEDRLRDYKGYNLIPDWACDLIDVYTDACPDGGGIVVGDSWAGFDWSEDLVPPDALIDELELLALIMAATTYGHEWKRRRVRFWVDNEVVRYALENRTCKVERIMRWLRVLYALEERFDFTATVARISSKDNVGADAISRRRLDPHWFERLQAWRPTIDVVPRQVILPELHLLRL
jgi:hypothetical protein